ncbi:hypothetical protein B0H14DRAFT_2416767 [Mycena olivaceomarginata]|nr:hypothetical protein B0H14DRAFT_2416767 [Mycena olivaceomarginata]
MPEYVESIISGTLVKIFVGEQPAGSLLVKNIWADTTEAKSSTHPSGSLANLRHVYPLDSACTALRGSSDSQTPLYPPRYATMAPELTKPIVEHGLVLTAVETHPHNVLLMFLDKEQKEYWCQVRASI